MRRSLAWLAAVLVVISNAVGLGFAWWNRSGVAEAALVLTEREVRVPPRETENTALALELRWVDPSRAPGAVSWLDAGKLSALGFDCSAAPTPADIRYYEGQIPRTAYAVLEFEGEAWTRYLESIPPGADRESALAGSHLVMVDAGLDPAALRRRHPERNRAIIARATVDIEVRRAASRPPTLAGRVTTVYPLQVNVPRSLRRVFEGLPERPRSPFEPRHAWRGTPLPSPPRYQVTLKWGRSLEPWLVEAVNLRPH